jgi:hypothetical protein
VPAVRLAQANALLGLALNLQIVAGERSAARWPAWPA